MKFNSKMLELARNSRGFTQKDLSEKLPKINQPNLSKIERGEFQVSDTTLNLIANALEYPIYFFFQNELRTPFSNIYYRKRSTISQREFNIIFSEMQIILKSIDYLLEEVIITEYPKYRFDLNEGWTPESVAIKARELLRIPNGPINEPIKYLEEAGIIVYFYDCRSDKFDGLTAYTDNGHPVIFLNKNLSNDRIKYNLSHEFGHLLMHIPCNIEPWRDEEMETNQMVGEFYMPTNDSKADLQSLSYNKLATLKNYWGISKAAIIYIARHRNYISESTFKYLMIELGRKNERKKETGYVQIDQPQLLKQIIEVLQNNLGFTSESLSRKLHLNLHDYIRFFESPFDSRSKVRLLRPSV